jgi:hypothetical protein
MNTNKTIKNWKWWVVLPIVLPVVAIISIPALLIFILQLMITAVEVVNIGDRPNKYAKRLTDWVRNK